MAENLDSQFQLPESARAVIPQELGQDFLSTLDRLMQVNEKKQMEDLLGFQESRGLVRSGDTNRRLVEEVLGPGVDRRNAQLLGLALEGARTGQGQRFQREFQKEGQERQQGFQKDILGLEQGFGREMFGKEAEFRQSSERFQASEARERQRVEFLNQLEQMKEQAKIQEQLLRLQQNIELDMFYRRKDAGAEGTQGFFGRGQIGRDLLQSFAGGFGGGFGQGVGQRTAAGVGGASGTGA